MLRQQIGWLSNVQRAKRPARLPVVLTRDEVHKVFAHLHGMHRLMAGLLYGSGLRLMECVRLRVKDVDFGYLRITVRDGKGAKDRVTMLPINLADRWSAICGGYVRNTRKSRSWIWPRLFAVCAGAQIPNRRSRMGVAVTFSHHRD